MLSYHDVNMHLLENELSLRSNRIMYAASVCRDMKNSYGVDVFLSLESIDSKLPINKNIAAYSSFESASSEAPTAKARLLEWIQRSLVKLINIGKKIYDIIVKCIGRILEVIKKPSQNRSTKRLDHIANLNGISPSRVGIIDKAVDSVLVSDIKPVTLPGIRKVWNLSDVSERLNSNYNNTLYGYYTVSHYKKLYEELQQNISPWLNAVMGSSSSFISEVERLITNTPKKISSESVSELERLIPKDDKFKLIALKPLCRDYSGNGISDLYQNLQTLNESLSSGMSDKNIITKSKQSLGSIAKFDGFSDKSSFVKKLSGLEKIITKMTDTKMSIVKFGSDGDLAALQKILVIDEKIRKFVFSVYRALNTISIFAQVEERHNVIANAIYQQKLTMLSGYKGIVSD